MGHQERLPPPRLSGRCGFGEGTFAGTRGNGEDAPIAAIRPSASEQQPCNQVRDITSRPAPQSASCRYGGLVIASRCGKVRRRRAGLAKYDIRRSTIRRPRDDMRRCTIRPPREPASEVAKIACSLRQLEPPAPAIGCALIFGSPVRSTELGSCRSPDW